jgi:predicted ribosome quality control (RQC) complex YloA/Tae2 family protein
MKVEIDTRKSIYDNASDYYEKSKKVRAKIAGLKKAIEDTKKLILAEEKKASILPEKKVIREKEWFEKFHYFTTSNGLLALGGKDAKSNEMIVKKHLEKDDLYFHADIKGAPSVVLKKGQGASEEDIRETAEFAGSFSSAWKSELGVVGVFYVKPEQVHTAAKSGEYLAQGSFMITGEKGYIKKVPVELAVTFLDGKLTVAPKETVSKKTDKYLLLRPARETKGESAKNILYKLKVLFPEAPIDIDWLLQVLPNGGSKIVK